MLDKRLVIVSGKGGVGKSAVAAGIGLMAQRHGLRILAVEMETGGGLAAHFGVGHLEFEPREVRPGLHAMHMVRSEALLEYLQLQLKLPGMGRFGAVARAFDALATAAPAVREIVTIGKILWEVREDRWDLVIVDAPPTGQIASYLRAPRSIAELVATGRIRSQSDWMEATLSDPAITELVLVTLPEELPTTETLETIDWVNETKVVGTPTVIANRVLEELRAKTPDGIAGEMVTLHKSLWTEQQEWLHRLPPDLVLPHLFGLFTPGEVAAHLSDDLEVLT
ncbi:MAG TPA: ArsA-related P-loop ATPase [Acidimicrobiia bacterium]|nr:ArsA-related P-loop ATPase [Acidimicrobiia bacterium]